MENSKIEILEMKIKAWTLRTTWVSSAAGWVTAEERISETQTVLRKSPRMHLEGQKDEKYKRTD